ncbi:MAG: hypothetical protein E7294_13995 [Lachnospiraceae bacterium]|nr:hypothetical protein [Lachnospiraceae bacterium]
MLNWVDFYCFISNLLTAIDTLLYCYDWITARNEQEKSDAEKGFISCAASYLVPGTIPKVTDMKIVLKGFEYDIAKTLLGFTLEAFGGCNESYFKDRITVYGRNMRTKFFIALFCCIMLIVAAESTIEYIIAFLLLLWCIILGRDEFR